MKKYIISLLPESIVNRLQGLYMIAGYHHAIIRKKRKAASYDKQSNYSLSKAQPQPSVTIYITNTNNKIPLELTLRTLLQTVTYVNFEIVVADNNSTDGSIELVESMAGTYPIQLLKGESKPQHEWYDQFIATNATEYWLGIHEDMMFIDAGWLSDMIEFMETHRDTYLLGGEYFPPGDGVEPVSHSPVSMRESLSTWIFCVRQGLHRQISTSFAFHSYVDEKEGKTIAYDQGGKLIEEVRRAGLGFSCMPQEFMEKWQHIANITWAFKYDMNAGYRMYKQHQVNDIKKRVRRLRKQSRRKTKSSPIETD